MTIAGIDYSMTSPAICFYTESDGEMNFANCECYFLTQLKKYEVSFQNVYGDYVEFDDDLNHRYDTISSYFLDRIYERDVKKVFIEDYSMGSTGRVFNIAENTGILKYRFWCLDIKYATVPPTVIKKFATGKGNSNKEKMQEAFELENSIRLKDELKQTEKQWNPSSDIIDAYYICKYGYTLLTT
jgi:Holliday junction resolvasome RuvABC endonuclease subunit